MLLPSVTHGQIRQSISCRFVFDICPESPNQDQIHDPSRARAVGPLLVDAAPFPLLLSLPNSCQSSTFVWDKNDVLLLKLFLDEIQHILERRLPFELESE